MVKRSKTEQELRRKAREQELIHKKKETRRQADEEAEVNRLYAEKRSQKRLNAEKIMVEHPVYSRCYIEVYVYEGEDKRLKIIEAVERAKERAERVDRCG